MMRSHRARTPPSASALWATVLVLSLLPRIALAQDPIPTAAPSASAPAAPAPPPKEAKAPERTALGEFNHLMETALFFDVFGGAIEVEKTDREGEVVKDASGAPVMTTIGFPFLVMVLVLGAIFFSLYFRFINIRAFKHAIDVVRGRYD
ncbi:MAG: hypothetical protein AAGA56_30370, partial [Myxococcota bacterium]